MGRRKGKVQREAEAIAATAAAIVRQPRRASRRNRSDAVRNRRGTASNQFGPGITNLINSGGGNDGRRRSRMPRAPREQPSQGGVPKWGPSPPVQESTPPRQQALRGAMSSLELRDKEKKVSEAGYLYGFVDPDFAVRGPLNDNNLPTVIITMRSRTPISFANFVADEPAYTGNSDSVMLDPAGRTCIVVVPHVRPSRDNVLNQDPIPYSAYAVSPEFNWCTLNPFEQPGSDLSAPCCPLDSQFDCPMPSWLLGRTLSTTSNETDYDFRCVGLRATLTCGSNLLNVSGSCVAGDMGDWFLPPEREIHDVANTGYDQPEFPSNSITRTMLRGFGDSVSRFTRSNDLGAIQNGKTFEAAFLPLHKRIEAYDNYLPGHAMFESSAIGSEGDNIANDVTNFPAVFFSLFGVNNTMRFALDVTWSFEAVVQQSSSLGFLRAQARLNSQFLVDYAVLQCVQTSGDLASMVRQWYQCAEGRVGYGLARGELMLPPPRPQVNTAAGAISATSFLTKLLNGSYNKQLRTIAKVGASMIPGAAPIAAIL